MQVFYHGNCIDGWVSAVLMKLAYRNAELTPVHYGGEIKVTQDDPVLIFFVDFCPDVKQLENLLELYPLLTIVVIDHHPKVFEVEDQLKDTRIQFVKSDCKSGAGLVFDYLNERAAYNSITFCYGESTINNLKRNVKYVQDYDLWNHEDEFTFYANSYLSSLKQDIDSIELWYDFLLNKSTSQLVMGKKLFEYKMEIVSNIVKYKEKIPSSKGMFAIINCVSSFVNEVSDQILKQDSTINFVVCYEYRGSGLKLSLRSRKNGFDVNALANTLGGGGHISAAGVMIKDKISVDNLIKLIA